MTDLEALKKEAADARQKAEQLRLAVENAEYKAAQADLEPIKALTERAHNCLCQWNHTDGCSWGYEQSASDPWGCDAHARWLRHYKNLIVGSPSYPAKATREQVEEILTAVEQLKPKVKNALFLLRQGLQP